MSFPKGAPLPLLLTLAALVTVLPASAEDWLPITPEELKMTADPNAPGAPAIFLYRQVDRDDQESHEYHYSRIKIFTEEGRDHANVEIPYVKGEGDIHKIEARTIRPDGTIINFDGKVYDKTIVKARGVKYLAKTFTLPDVQAGTIIEYRYIQDIDSDYVFDSRWLLSDDLFTKRAKFSLRQNTEFALVWSWPLGLPPGTDPPKNDHNMIRLETQNVPAFQAEDHMPPEDEMKFRVEFVYSRDIEKNTDKFWSQEGKRLYHGVQDFADKRGDMANAVREIVSPSDTPEVKLQKIYARTQQIRDGETGDGETGDRGNRGQTGRSSIFASQATKVDDNRTQNFMYDALNRIQQAYTTGPNWGETFSPTATAPGVAPTTSGIDPWGNLTNRSGVTGKTNTEPLSAAATTQNQLTGFTYDAAGNMTQNGSATYTYDAENHLTTTAGVTYTYDGDGQRVKKSNGTLYWGGTSSDALAETDLSGNLLEEYIYFNGKRVARREPSGDVRYYFSDHLGTADVIAYTTGAIKEESDYYPYGGEIPVSGSDTNHYKFTGKERDAESGLDDFDARYYASALGRFVIPDWSAGEDPVPYAKFGNPQSLNLYGYVSNNPTTLTDPDGHGVGDFLVGAMDAVVSDFTGGVRPLGQGNSDFQSGQQLGHSIAVVGGAVETAFGVTTTAAGGAEALGTSPAAATGVGAVIPAAGVAVAVAGVAITAHGATIVSTAIKNMSSRVGDFTSGEKKQMDQDNASKNGGQNKCTECGQDVQKVQSKKGHSAATSSRPDVVKGRKQPIPAE